MTPHNSTVSGYRVPDAPRLADHAIACARIHLAGRGDVFSSRDIKGWLGLPSGGGTILAAVYRALCRRCEVVKHARKRRSSYVWRLPPVPLKEAGDR